MANIEIVGITTNDKDIIKTITKEELEKTGGYSANICYTQKDWDDIIKENVEKTKARAEGNKKNRHHSVFGHTQISMYLTDIPKLLCMTLNNEKEYNTSEKSGRYTIMQATGKEAEIYNKWIKILEEKIKKEYPNEEYLTDLLIHKKAMENARYMLSVFTKTKMEYTTSYRQLNYLYSFAEKMINKETNNQLINEFKPYLIEFRDALKNTGYITDDIYEYRGREFSLIKDDNTFDDHFSRTYSVNYHATFACLADLQRHRSLDYSLSLDDANGFFVPPIIKNDQALVDEWLHDIYSLKNIYPQGTLVTVNESGKYEDFILKLYERLCTAAQLEVTNITKDTLTKYIKALENSDSSADKKILEEMIKYSKGARCTFPNFECTEKCHFNEGITLTRKI